MLLRNHLKRHNFLDQFTTTKSNLTFEWRHDMVRQRIGRIAIKMHHASVDPFRVLLKLRHQPTFPKHSRVMPASDPRSGEMGDNPIGSHNRLKFNGVNSLVAIVDLPLIIRWTGDGTHSPINEAPRIWKRSAFPQHSIRENF